MANSAWSSGYIPDMSLDPDVCYRALMTRDARFDGRFFTGVTSTGIYCRPICPARTPKPEHCRFFPSAAAAHEAGFRPCLRCRPEVSPKFAAWRGTWNSVARALTLIEDGALDDADVEALASRLGMGARHLRRLFDQHLGASPVSVAQTRRVWLAKQLIDETDMPLGQIAVASGFGSLRRFNDAMQRTYGRPPTALRRANVPDARDESVNDVGRARTVRSKRVRVTSPTTDMADVTVKLPYSAPYDWPAIVAFLAPRTIPGVEVVTAESYRRVIATQDSYGVVEVRPVPGASFLLARIQLPRVTVLGPVVHRLRRLFDTGADPTAIGAVLSAHPRLAPLVARWPGLRVPGVWDGFEMAVRAILGQQITVAGATRLTARLVARYGAPIGDRDVHDVVREAEQRPVVAGALTTRFPEPATLAAVEAAELAEVLGMPQTRGATIVGLARAIVADPTMLQTSPSLDEAIARLTALPGIGDWTAHYVAMRALREPDAFPASDLVIRQELSDGTGALAERAVIGMAEAWRPWRSYAAMYLWMARLAA